MQSNSKKSGRGRGGGGAELGQSLLSADSGSSQLGAVGLSRPVSPAGGGGALGRAASPTRPASPAVGQEMTNVVGGGAKMDAGQPKAERPSQQHGSSPGYDAKGRAGQSIADSQ